MKSVAMEPLFDVPAPDGAGGGGPAAGAADTTTAQTPIALTADSAFTAPGIDKPVKFGEFQSRFVDKAAYTRASQEWAAKEKQFQEQLSTAQKQLQAASAAKPASPTGPTFEEELNALSERAYVDGKTAAGLVAKIVKQGIGPIAERLQQRDEVIRLLYQKLTNMDGSVAQLVGRTSQADMASKMASVRKDANLPDDEVIGEFLQDIYCSHEGSDLDQEFPTMVKTRWSALVNAVRAWDKKNAAAQRGLIGIPRPGGTGTPGKPLKEGFKDAETLAKELFPMFRGDLSAT